MCSKILTILMIIALCSLSRAGVTNAPVFNDITSIPMPEIFEEHTSIENDDNKHVDAQRTWQRHTYYQKSTPSTTPRPFVRYWNNIMRNVRVPVPRITWNMTNPIANLFGMGTSNNLVETYPVDDYFETDGSVGTHSKRKYKKSRKNKRTKKHHHKQEANKNELIAQQQQQQQQEQERQQFLAQYDRNSAMYFYDPNSGQYYTIQPVQTIANIRNENLFYNALPNYYAINDVAELGTLQQQQHQQYFLHDDATQIESTPEAEEQNNFDANNTNDDDDSDINLDEAEEIDLDKLVENSRNTENDTNTASIENVSRNTTPFPASISAKDDELVRNLLGTFMKDDYPNRQKQRAHQTKYNSQTSTGKQRPRTKYYFLVGL